jgi:hypothetical protein
MGTENPGYHAAFADAVRKPVVAAAALVDLSRSRPEPGAGAVGRPILAQRASPTRIRRRQKRGADRYRYIS